MPEAAQDDVRPEPADAARLLGWARRAATRAAASGVADAVDVARAVGAVLPLPGQGATALRWAVLAALAEADVTVARVVEPHVDALAILAEAGVSTDDTGSWGVFAAESRGARLEARDADGSGYRLTGRKPWCSLGDVLDHALVTAWDGEQRRLFAIDLAARGVAVLPSSGWVSRGLPAVTSVGIDFDDVPARPVGRAGWYLARPGFAWGGVGVAACWVGAARGLLDPLVRGPHDLIGSLHLGRADAALFAAESALAAAARDVDAGGATGAAGARLALRVRAVAAAATESALAEAAHGLGPAPLAFDAAYAARVADLQMYVRQHHGERDLAALGESLRPGPAA